MSVTAAGRTASPTVRPFPGNLPQLECSSSRTPNSPAATIRHRADITSVAAPGKSANQACPTTGTGSFQAGPSRGVAAHQEYNPSGQQWKGHQASKGRVSSPQGQTADPLPSADAVQVADLQTNIYTDTPGRHSSLIGRNEEDPRLQLSTQMQQLNELSHLMSQRLTLDDGQASNYEAAAAQQRPGATSNPEGLGPDANSQDAFEAIVFDHNMRPVQHAQHVAGPQHEQHDILPQQGTGPQHAQQDKWPQHVRQSAEVHTSLGEPLATPTEHIQEDEHSEGKLQYKFPLPFWFIRVCLCG